MPTRTGAGTRSSRKRLGAPESRNVLADMAAPPAPAAPAAPLMSSIKPISANPRPKGMFAKSHRPGFDATE